MWPLRFHGSPEVFAAFLRKVSLYFRSPYGTLADPLKEPMVLFSRSFKEAL